MQMNVLVRLVSILTTYRIIEDTRKNTLMIRIKTIFLRQFTKNENKILNTEISR
ncbi:unnamed protein product [Acanthoscelides obtectus]|uniref:Uncharacterized protein n=1 Tax=Acanthoscelides obtectus TaxID=200917 RepID=A0A9P0KS50_ACAOB|nr:unnamed protein product [Acanthoscelides obtectus]CAK1656190.1 hypothetical protein AOBTE_LOCUS19607 [Acanthoscelides obtectus]